MAKALNFNSWIKTLPAPPGSLAAVWEAKRGRMTKSSVEARALKYGMPPGTGANMWDFYTRGMSVSEA